MRINPKSDSDVGLTPVRFCAAIFLGPGTPGLGNPQPQHLLLAPQVDFNNYYRPFRRGSIASLPSIAEFLTLILITFLSDFGSTVGPRRLPPLVDQYK